MPVNDALRAMLPEHLLLGGMVVLIVAALTGQGRRWALPLALVAVAAAACAAFALSLTGLEIEPFPGQYAVSPAIYRIKGMLLLLALPVLLMSRLDFEDHEFPLLLVSALYGVALLPSAQNALVLFLGLEMVSIPVYALIVLAFRRPQAAESALKYLILSGAASATFLMGMSLMYGVTGTMATGGFAQLLGQNDTLARAAVGLTVAALFLKAAIVPFHAWAPDTYEGASVPVTAFMATLSKAAVLFVALRLFDGALLSGPAVGMLAALPLVSIVWGNLAAMRQESLRRMLAYSSIAHAGYLFYAFLGDAVGRESAVVFYLVVYAASTLLAFAALPPHPEDATRDRLDTLDGLFHRDPLAAVLLAVAMLSLAGLPPFPGFTAKFMIFRSVIAAGYTQWAVLALVGSFLGLYFYLRVIMRMFMNAGAGVRTHAAGSTLARAAGIACLMATLVLTFAPGWVMAQM